MFVCFVFELHMCCRFQCGFHVLLLAKHTAWDSGGLRTQTTKSLCFAVIHCYNAPSPLIRCVLSFGDLWVRLCSPFPAKDRDLDFVSALLLLLLCAFLSRHSVVYLTLALFVTLAGELRESMQHAPCGRKPSSTFVSIFHRYGAKDGDQNTPLRPFQLNMLKTY